MPNTDVAIKMATIQIEDSQVPLVDIRSTGDILLDVHFKNISECTKSIPKDALRSLRTRKLPITSPRILYRVRLDTLKKHSDYFRTMLKPQFAEGLAVEKALKVLADTNLVAAELEPERLPRISIVDEDTSTKTFGREVIFRDMLRIIHGAVRTDVVSRYFWWLLNFSLGSPHISDHNTMPHRSCTYGRSIQRYACCFSSYAESPHSP
jgi:hypothetical protein